MGTTQRKMLSMVLLIVFLIGCGSRTATYTQSIKVGFITPLTGDGASYGESARGGAELALQEINAAGGIDGRPLELIYEDGKCSGKEAATAANKLLTADHVIALTGMVCSAELLAIAPIAEQAKTVALGVATSSPALTTAGDYIFRIWPSDVMQSQKMVNYVAGEGYRTAALLYTNSDYNVALKTVFRENFEQQGGKIVADESYEQDAKDFRTELQKIKAADPDVLYLIPYGEGGLVLKQAKELGLQMPIIASDTIGTKEILAVAGPATEGVVYTTPKFDENASVVVDFLQRYREVYGDDPSIAVVSANAYDAVKLLADGLRQGESSDTLKRYLYQVRDYVGVGGTITIDANGDAGKPYQLMIITNGTFVPYERG